MTEIDPELIFEVIEKQAEEGVDFMTVHCGITKRRRQHLKNEKGCGVVSRGGSFLVNG